MTMISRLLGFAREMVLAYVFGASAGMDAFLIAFKLPNFMRRLFAEGAFSQAFVPVLSEYHTRESPASVQRFINHMVGTLGVLVLAVVGAAMLLSPILVHVFAPGFAHDSVRFALASHMLRITFPYLLFISLTAFSAAVLNSYNRFAIAAITPVWLNIVLIIMALWARSFFNIPITALAWGVSIAGIIQLLFLLPFLKRTSHLPCPKPNWRDPGVKRVLKLMVPALFGVSVAQLSILIDSVFASFLPVGSVSWLYYSDRLTNFPLGVFGVALATVVLPHLSQKHASANKQSYASTLDWAIRNVLFIGVPSALGLLLLAGPILLTLLGHGEFTLHDVLMTKRSLMAFSIGVPAFMLVKVLASGFYARQNIKTPVKIATIALVVNMLLNAALIVPLAHAGLALATTIAAVVNAGLLLYALYKQSVYIPAVGWGLFILRLLLANVTMSVFLLGVKQPLSVWQALPVMHQFIALGWRVIAAVLFYLGVLRLTGFRLSSLWVFNGDNTCN